MIKSKIASAALFASFLLVGTQAANAGLIGSDVTYNSLFPDISTVFFSVPSQTVTPGTSITDATFGSNLVFTSTFTDTSIITEAFSPNNAFINNASFNGWDFLFSGINITGVSLDSGSDPSFSGAAVTFDAGNIFVNLAGLTPADGSKLILDVASVQVGTVPEPITLSLFGAGVAGAAAMRRRKAKKV